MKARINVVGQILSSKLEWESGKVGNFFLIEPIEGTNAFKGTTSFSIFYSTTPEMENCFDDWVEDEEALEIFLSAWDIRWL